MQGRNTTKAFAWEKKHNREKMNSGCMIDINCLQANNQHQNVLVSHNNESAVDYCISRAAEENIPDSIRWYALYTRSRYEKRAYLLLRELGVETYLPLVKTWRVWSDRKKQVDMPLLPSYLFVHTDASNYRSYYNILNTPGIVRFIAFEGQAVAIPDYQIAALQRLNSYGIDMQCLELCPEPGTHVKIIRGPMKGLTGEVVSVGKNQKLIMRLNPLDKCITLNISLAMVSKI